MAERGGEEDSERKMPSQHTRLTHRAFAMPIGIPPLHVWKASPRGEWLAVVSNLVHKLRTDLTARRSLVAAGGIVVFDIDDTLVRGSRDTLIAPVAKLFRDLVRAGAHVHVLTARPESIRRETEAMLAGHKLTGYKGLHMMPEDLYARAHTEPDVTAVFKTQARSAILQLYRGGQQAILASVGDMLWDVAVFPFNPLVADLEHHSAGAYLQWPTGELSLLLPS